MEQEDLISISQELEEWEMSINDTLKQCQIGIDIVEKASLECEADSTCDKIVEATQEAEDNNAEPELKTEYAKKISTKVDSALIMKEITLLSKEGEDGEIKVKYKKFYSPSKLQFQCDECPIKYTRKSNLNAHKTVKHKNTRLDTGIRKCNWCEFTIERIFSKSSVKTLMNAHKVNEHPFGKKCDQCEFHTTYSNGMRLHIRKLHTMENYICRYCGFKTISKFSLKKHQHEKHFKESRCRGEEIRCKFCDLSFTTRTLAAHMKIDHPKERLFKCDKCSYRSNWMHNLRLHKDGKHGQTKLVCNKCKFESFWRNDLLNHKRTVHGIFRNKSKLRGAPKTGHNKLCDLCGFQTNSDRYKAIDNHKRSCMASQIDKIPAQIEDARSQIISCKKIPCNERSAKEKRILQKLQQQLCYLKNKLRTFSFKKSERMRRKKPNLDINPEDVKDTEESDAAKILSEVEKHQADMSWNDKTPNSVRDESSGIEFPTMDITSRNEVETQEIIAFNKEKEVKAPEVKEPMKTIKQDKKLLNLSRCEKANTSKHTAEEEVLKIQTFEEGVSITQRVKEKFPMTPTAEEGASMKHTFKQDFCITQTTKKGVSITQTVEEGFSMTQTLQEVKESMRPIKRDERVLKFSECDTTNTKKQTVKEGLSVTQTVKEGTLMTPTDKGGVLMSKAIEEEVSMTKPDDSGVSMTQSLKEEVPKPQNIDKCVSMTPTVEEEVLMKQTINLKNMLTVHNLQTEKLKHCSSSIDTKDLNDSVELENYNYFKILLGIK